MYTSIRQRFYEKYDPRRLLFRHFRSTHKTSSFSLIEKQHTKRNKKRRYSIWIKYNTQALISLMIAIFTRITN
jgi:hypothetical protein